MFHLLQQFIDIALWRKGPQDLPASATILVISAAIYTATGFMQVRLMGYRVLSSCIVVLVDLGMTALMLGMVLSLMSKRARWLQTLTALLGVGTLLGILDIVVRVVMLWSGVSAESPTWGLTRLLLLLVVVGHVYQQALESGLMVGMSLTLAIAILTESVTTVFVPLASQGAPAGPG